MGDFGRPQMFSPIRRSSLYFALWRLDIDTLASTRAGAPSMRKRDCNGGVRTNPSWVPDHADRVRRQEGAVYAEGGVASQVLAVRSASARLAAFASSHQRFTSSPESPG